VASRYWIILDNIGYDITINSAKTCVGIDKKRGMARLAR
jgi:hypothetical protein